MKKIKYLYLLLAVFFLLLLLVSNVLLEKERGKSEQERNVLLNRIATRFQEDYGQGVDAENLLGTIYAEQKADLKLQYAEESLPEEIVFLSVREASDEFVRLSDKLHQQRLWPIYGKDGMAGFLMCTYADGKYQRLLFLMNGGIIVSFLMIFLFLGYVHLRILRPFHHFSEYPVRLSQGEVSQKLPETKNRLFGKFIWGVNMLGDKLANDKKQIDRLMRERQVLLTTIAHGIKTPVVNIKLYASAIATGLYQPDGMINEKDAKVAEKIDKNADEITALVRELLETTSTGMVDYEPEPGTFYVKELVEYIEQEYKNRFHVHRIPYQVECLTGAIIHSDKSGLIRILSQLLENAMKYGDGTGIFIGIEKQEEGFYFTIRNKGNLIPEKEIPYVFNSFWRGSNAEGVEGSGIGLFEAKTIASRLGGNIFVKNLLETKEVEFVVFVAV